ncbi:inositol monophosphatase 1 isoform X2 [Apis cerana]|uniref:inositol monophosphatase 1 isoform X2 n=1 Tax=Apis cerana TaxID=7461 RepID=UPI002B2235E5|nr:inositol monophosphatase 1 isoform X2 [Apis cerana]
MSNTDKYYTVVLRLVLEAGSIVREKINQPKDAMTKSCEVDLVTEWDQNVEKLLMEGISSKFPDHKFIGEEASSLGSKIELTEAPTWIIDPIDVYNPILDQLFTARKGQGAFLNGRPLHVSGQKELRKALIMMEMGTSRDPEKMKIVLENANILAPHVHGIRALGSAALNMCMVALGGADISFEFGIHAWDVAAGDIIVREAGGVCIDPAGGPFDVMSRRVLCASTMELAQKLAKILVQYYPERD